MAEHYVPVAHNSYIGDTKLTPRELMMYAYLHSRRNYFSDTTITNFKLIVSEISFVKKQDDNKKHIENVLLSLHTKGVLIFDYKDIKKDSKLVISFKFFEKGYTQIPYSCLLMTNDPEKFMILCYIKKVNRSISFVEFADVLGKSERHVKELIPDMEQKQMINVVHGRYYTNENKQKRQEKNNYDMNENYEEKVQNEPVPILQDEGYIEQRDHNWYNRDVFPNVDDYLIYQMTEDEKLKKYAESRMKALSKKEFGAKRVQENMEEAERKLKNIQKQIEDEDIMDIIQNSSELIIKRDSEHLSIADVDQLRRNDHLALIEEYEDNDKHGYRAKRKTVKYYLINDIVTGNYTNDMGYLKYEPYILERLFNKFKDIVRGKGIFTKNDFITINQYRENILAEINKGKIIDSDWEGDEYISYDGKTEQNVSKENRINEDNNTKKREEIRLYQEKKTKEEEERNSFVANLFEEE